MFKWTVAAMTAVSCCIAVHAKDTRTRTPVQPAGSLRVPAAALQAQGLSAGASATGEPAGHSRAASKDSPGSSASRWEVRASDITLARTLERWALTAGHKLKWDASRNFLIGASDVYLGTFEGALQQVLSSPGIRFSDYPLEACIYANTPPLVRITRQGEQTRECVAATAH